MFLLFWQSFHQPKLGQFDHSLSSLVLSQLLASQRAVSFLYFRLYNPFRKKTNVDILY
jgi:hypothetical protein